MARWEEIERSSPRFAAALRERFDAHTHKTLATLRSDGSPRISGIEAFFAAGELWSGSMPNARKALDLRRDPRFALHSGSADPPDWDGDAKIAGRVEEVTDEDRRRTAFEEAGVDPPSPESHVLRYDVEEAVVVGLNEDRDGLVIELWRPGQDLKRIER